MVHDKGWGLSHVLYSICSRSEPCITTIKYGATTTKYGAKATEYGAKAKRDTHSDVDGLLHPPPHPFLFLDSIPSY